MTAFSTLPLSVQDMKLLRSCRHLRGDARAPTFEIKSCADYNARAPLVLTGSPLPWGRGEVSEGGGGCRYLKTNKTNTSDAAIRRPEIIYRCCTSAAEWHLLPVTKTDE